MLAAKAAELEALASHDSDERHGSASDRLVALRLTLLIGGGSDGGVYMELPLGPADGR
jgi:hypothetical protein